MGKAKKINVKETEITILNETNGEYISLTNMSKYNGGVEIEKWFRNKKTIEFLGVWETMNNPNFNYPEFGVIKESAGNKNFTLSIKEWVNKTNAIGIISKAGRYGGTYAHKDIAYEFGMWISPEFKLLIIKEFDRLKNEEARRNEIGWEYQRFLSKVNYKLHTDSIKENIIPEMNLPHGFQYTAYVEEAEYLNLAVFGKTSKQWRKENPDKPKGKNIRDYADLHQLNVIANLESLNSLLINDGMKPKDRFKKLCETAKFQLKSLYNGSSYSKIEIQSPNKKKLN
jgi:hypothetical protein